jgi:hypothetical protein
MCITVRLSIEFRVKDSKFLYLKYMRKPIERFDTRSIRLSLQLRLGQAVEENYNRIRKKNFMAPLRRPYYNIL